MSEIFFIKALQDALIEEMHRDENVFMMGEDIGTYGGCFGVTRGLLDKFGEKRVIDTPMSESSMVGWGIGSSLLGLRPIIEIMFMDFITLCMDQIINQASKMRYIYGGAVKTPIVIRAPAGAGRRYGASHSQSLEAMFMNIPGLKIVAPSTPYDVKGLMKSSIRDDNLVLFIESKLLYWSKGGVPREEYTVPFGKANIIKDGSDITIVSYSRMINECFKASIELEKIGIDCEIIDLRTLYPLDLDAIIKSIKKTGKLVVVEEGCKTAGVGAEISASICEEAFEYLSSPILRIAGLDIPIPYSPVLEDVTIPDYQKIRSIIIEKLFKDKKLQYKNIMN